MVSRENMRVFWSEEMLLWQTGHNLFTCELYNGEVYIFSVILQSIYFSWE